MSLEVITLYEDHVRFDACDALIISWTCAKKGRHVFIIKHTTTA